MDYHKWLAELPDWLDSNREPDGTLHFSKKVADQVIEMMRAATHRDAQLWGELLIDADGEAHFICHTKGKDFQTTKVALLKFIAILEGQIDREQDCPFYELSTASETPAIETHDSWLDDGEILG